MAALVITVLGIIRMILAISVGDYILSLFFVCDDEMKYNVITAIEKMVNHKSLSHTIQTQTQPPFNRAISLFYITSFWGPTNWLPLWPTWIKSICHIRGKVICDWSRPCKSPSCLFIYLCTSPAGTEINIVPRGMIDDVNRMIKLFVVAWRLL